MNNLEVIEFKKRMYQNKENFEKDIKYVCNVFGVEDKDYLKRYNELGEKMIEKMIQINKLKNEMNDLNYNYEKVKYNFIVDNDIDIKEEVKNKKDKVRIVDELYRMGFISSDYYSIMKEYFWNNRKRMSYELVNF